MAVWFVLKTVAMLAEDQPVKLITVRTPDGVRVSAHEWGNPRGPEIVFIHGISQSHLSWSRQINSELARTFRLITYDIRGHGGSDKPLEPIFYRDQNRWADELKAVMEAAKVKKPVLVGWSYGGRIVAEYLLAHGDRDIRGINFVAAFTKVVPEVIGPAGPAVWKMTSDKLAENIANTLLFLKFCTVKPLPPDELQFMLAYNMVVPHQVRGHMMGRSALYEEGLRKIKVPVLITHGRDDQVALFPMAEYTAQVVPHAQSSIYEGVGHMPFWEDTSRFNRELGEFVNKSVGA